MEKKGEIVKKEINPKNLLLKDPEIGYVINARI